jgi:dTDP-4-amino-4,6-dideoxygalactose transaminase
LAAVARAQFAKMDDIRQQREQVWRRYQKGLADLARAGDIMLHRIREEAEPNWHIYAFRVTDPDRRGDLLDWLDSRGIKASFHFVPLHSSPYGQEQLDYRPEDLPITEMVSKSLIRLPIYPNLAPADQDYIIDAIYDYFRNGHRNL